VLIPYNALTGTADGILTLRALKAEPMNELFEDVIWHESLLVSLSEGGLVRILRCIVNAEVSVTRLKEILGKIQTNLLQTKTMTLADQLRQEGKLESEQQEIIKAKQEGLSEEQLRAFRTAVFSRLGNPSRRVRRESARPLSPSTIQHASRHSMKVLFVLNHSKPSRKNSEG